MGIQAKETTGAAMSQVPVKWCCIADLQDKPEAIAVYGDEPVAVVPLSELRAWLKEEFRCDCGRGLFGEPHLVWCKHRIYERLLASLGEVGT